MDVHLSTLGCRLNEAELSAWSRALRARGHRVVPAPTLAQVLVINSCAVTTEAARKSRQLVSRLHRKNPAARLVVTGCYAALEPAKVARLAGVDLVLGNADKDQLVARLERDLDLHSMPEIATEPAGSHLYRTERTRAFVKVQDGCRNRCAFCVVTIARGQERSRPIAEIVQEIQELCTEGYREVVITGVHLGGYGADLGCDLRQLVGAVITDTDAPRVRLSSLEPWDLPDDFFALWRHDRLMPHLHLPLQSGCDSVLNRMVRRCSVAEYERLVADAREHIPNLNVTTDLLVGFPGETDAEHAATLSTVERIGFGHMHVFSFSARDGTTAARMSGAIAPDKKRERSKQAHQLAARMKVEQLARYVGDTRPVLWEAARTGGVHGGYTDNYLRVETVAPPGVALENTIALAQLTAHTDELLLCGPHPHAP